MPDNSKKRRAATLGGTPLTARQELRDRQSAAPVRKQPEGQPPQPHAPPQQPPPPPTGAVPPPEESPPRPTVVSSLTVSACPCGQVAGSPDWLIGLVSRNVSPQARQRNSYRGTSGSYPAVRRSPSAVFPALASARSKPVFSPSSLSRSFLAPSLLRSSVQKRRRALWLALRFRARAR